MLYVMFGGKASQRKLASALPKLHYLEARSLEKESRRATSDNIYDKNSASH